MLIQNNSIFIVDSINTALACLCMYKDKEYSIIIEQKNGSMDDDIYSVVLLILEPCKDRIVDVIKTPDTFFLYNNGKYNGIVEEWKIRNRLKKEYNIDAYDQVFMSKTSAFNYLYLPKGYELIEHGTGDYYKMNVGVKNTKKYIKNLLKKTHKLIFPKTKINFVYSMYGHSMSSYIDCMKIELGVGLKNLFCELIELVNGRDLVLWMPTIGVRKSNGFEMLNESDIDRQIEVFKNLVVANELILIKHHQTLKKANYDILLYFSDMLKERGIDQIDIDCYMPLNIFNKIPAEIIINILKIKKVVSDESSVFWNLACYRDIIKLSTISSDDVDNFKYKYVKYLRGKGVVIN